MTTILSVQITVNEEKVSPARVTEEMVKGFVFLREGYFGLREADLSLDISTITVTKPKRERHSRHAEKEVVDVVCTCQHRFGEHNQQTLICEMPDCDCMQFTVQGDEA